MITHVSVEGLPFNLKIESSYTVGDALVRAETILQQASGRSQLVLVPTGNVVYSENTGTLPTKTVRFTDNMKNVHVSDPDGKLTMIK